MFQWPKFVQSSIVVRLSCTFKTKVFADKSNIIEAKEVYSQLSFERYKEKLMLCNFSLSVYVPRITDWHHESCRVMTNGDRE